MNQDKLNNGQSSRQTETINLREIIEEYLIYWKWIVASAVLFLVMGGVYLMTKSPVYEFRASVLVMDPRSQMSEMSILSELKQMGITTSRNATSNEERVLRSTHLMKRVVDELSLHTNYSRKVRLHREDLYNDSPYRVELDSTSLSSISNTLSLEIELKSGKYHVEGSYSHESFSYTLDKLPAIIQTPAGNVTISLTDIATKPLKNYSNGRNARPPLDYKIFVSIIHPNRTAQWLASTGINTEIDRFADEIWITFRSNNIQRGKDVLNNLVKLYNRDAVEQITQSAIFSSIFIDGRLQLLEEELSEEEQRIESYKQLNELTNIEADAELFLLNNSKYFAQQLEAEIQLQLVEYLLQYVRNPANKFSMIPDPGLKDVNIANVINEYNQLLMTRERVIQGGSENNPMLVTLNRQADNLHNSIVEGMNSLRSAMDIRLQELIGQNSTLRTRLRDLPRLEREFIEIKRQQQVKEALYVFLLQKREEASLSKAVATNKARLLNAPDSAKQVAPRKATVMGLFLLLGVLLPILFIFVRNLLRTSINSRSDVEKLTNIPILSELALGKSAEPLFDHTDVEEPNGELFRLLRAKLQFVMNAPKEKVVLVTSTQPGEGKSFVSVNLSVSLSLMDKKVLLIGLDLRKPMLAKMLGLNGKEGITAYLAGNNEDPRSLICKMADFPNLDVLPAGVIPPNPNELIVKEKFDKLFDDLKPYYDYIILDTSPVGAVSDTYLIDRVADICLYVCRSEYSDKRNIEFINRLDKEGTLKRIYIVINAVNFESNKYAYYRKYGYGYGYGYSLNKK